MSIQLDFHQSLDRLAQSPAWESLGNPKRKDNAIRMIAMTMLESLPKERLVSANQLYSMIRTCIEKNSWRIDAEDKGNIKEIWKQCHQIGAPGNDPFWRALMCDDFLYNRQVILSTIQVSNKDFVSCYADFESTADKLKIPMGLLERSFVIEYFKKLNSQELKLTIAQQIIHHFHQNFPHLLVTFCTELNHLGIEDRRQLAVELAQYHPHHCVKYFKKFNISDPLTVAECFKELFPYGPQVLVRYIKELPLKLKWDVTVILALHFPEVTNCNMDNLNLSEEDRNICEKLLLALKCCGLIFNPEYFDHRHFLDHLLQWIIYDEKYRFPVPEQLKEYWLEGAFKLIGGELESSQAERIIEWIIAQDLIPEDRPPNLQHLPFNHALLLMNALFKKYPEWSEKHYQITLKS